MKKSYPYHKKDPGSKVNAEVQKIEQEIEKLQKKKEKLEEKHNSDIIGFM